MMLGIAASSSTMNETGLRSQGGAYSTRNSAAPIATGVAISRPRNELKSVPYRYGQIPNSCLTGSQFEVVTNPKPYRCMAGQESSTSSTTRPASRAITSPLNPVTTPRKIWSAGPAVPIRDCGGSSARACAICSSSPTEAPIQCVLCACYDRRPDRLGNVVGVVDVDDVVGHVAAFVVRPRV